MMPGNTKIQYDILLVFRRKDLCEAKQNVECSKKRSKYYATLWGGGGGVKCSVLNMNAMLCSHYSIHVFYALLSLYSIHVYYALLSLYSIHVYYALLSLYSIHFYYATLYPPNAKV